MILFRLLWILAPPTIQPESFFSRGCACPNRFCSQGYSDYGIPVRTRTCQPVLEVTNGCSQESQRAEEQRQLGFIIPTAANHNCRFRFPVVAYGLPDSAFYEIACASCSMVKRLAAGRERSSQIGGGRLSIESDSTGTKVEAVLPRDRLEWRPHR